MIGRRAFLGTTLSIAALAEVQQAWAQAHRRTISIGMALEPTPGLDPTTGAASSISEVSLYNIFETLTKIHADGSVSPLLAESWQIAPDLRTYTFRLRRGVRFSNGELFNAHTVKFAFDRAGSEKSVNKDKRTFANITTQVVDDYTVVLLAREVDPNFLFLLGQGTAAIVEPKSAETNATNPIGTGPFKLGNWTRGSSVELVKWEGFRSAAAIQLQRAVFRFIPDPAAQLTALLSGDVDAFPRVSGRAVEHFRRNGNFQILVSGSRAKTILALNHKRKPLDDIRVRQALCRALDRDAIIKGAADGFGVPIGSYYPPSAPGYLDLTKVNAHDPASAEALLREAGVQNLELTMTLPPIPYARQGGDVVSSMLSKIGVKTKIQNVEWAQWLSGTYGNKNYDVTIISHAEPFDLGNFSRPGYYWNYQNAKFDDLYNRYKQSARESDRLKLLAEIQRLVADDAAHCYLYSPRWVTIAKKSVKGLWNDMPIFVNDLSAMSI